EREASLIRADVQRLAMGIRCGCCVVLALVEKGSSLLPVQPVVVELDSVHLEDRGALGAVKDPGIELGKLLQRANAGVHAFYDVFCRSKVADRADDSHPARWLVPGLGERLQGNDVVV